MDPPCQIMMKLSKNNKLQLIKHASSISLHLALSWFFMILLYFFSPSILYFISNFNCHCKDCNMILYSFLLRSVGVFASIYRKALVTLRYRIWQFAYIFPVYSYVLQVTASTISSPTSSYHIALMRW